MSHTILAQRVSALLFSTGLELARTIAAIKDSVDLSTGTALARKLDRIESITSLELVNNITAVKESVDLSSATALAKLNRIEEMASAEGRLSATGLRNFYASREEANKQTPIADFLQSANSDLLICALSAYRLIRLYSDLFEDLLTKGCNVRLLLPDKSVVKNESLIRHLAPSRDINRTPDRIDDALGYLREVWVEAQARNLKGKLEVRLLDFIPTMGFIAIDGDTPRGKIRVEQYVYKSRAADRPAYEVIPTRDGRGIYHFLQRQFELCWDEATKWELSQEEPNVE